MSSGRKNFILFCLQFKRVFIESGIQGGRAILPAAIFINSYGNIQTHRRRQFYDIHSSSHTFDCDKCDTCSLEQTPSFSVMVGCVCSDMDFSSGCGNNLYRLLVNQFSHRLTVHGNVSPQYWHSHPPTYLRRVVPAYLSLWAWPKVLLCVPWATEFTEKQSRQKTRFCVFRNYF